MTSRLHRLLPRLLAVLPFLCLGSGCVTPQLFNALAPREAARTGPSSAEGWLELHSAQRTDDGGYAVELRVLGHPTVRRHYKVLPATSQPTLEEPWPAPLPPEAAVPALEATAASASRSRHLRIAVHNSRAAPPEDGAPYLSLELGDRLVLHQAGLPPFTLGHLPVRRVGVQVQAPPAGPARRDPARQAVAILFSPFALAIDAVLLATMPLWWHAAITRGL